MAPKRKASTAIGAAPKRTKKDDAAAKAPKKTATRASAAQPAGRKSARIAEQTKKQDEEEMVEEHQEQDEEVEEPKKQKQQGKKPAGKPAKPKQQAKKTAKKSMEPEDEADEAAEELDDRVRQLVATIMEPFIERVENMDKQLKEIAKDQAERNKQAEDTANAHTSAIEDFHDQFKRLSQAHTAIVKKAQKEKTAETASKEAVKETADAATSTDEAVEGIEKQIADYLAGTEGMDAFKQIIQELFEQKQLAGACYCPPECQGQADKSNAGKPAQGDRDAGKQPEQQGEQQASGSNQNAPAQDIIAQTPNAPQQGNQAVQGVQQAATDYWGNQAQMIERFNYFLQTKGFIDGQTQPGPSKDANGSYSLRWDMLMDTTDILLSIASVTEAIESHSSTYHGESIISLFDETALAMASKYGDDLDLFGATGVRDFRAARAGRTLYLPWLWHPNNEEAMPQSAEYEEAIKDLNKMGHWILCVMTIPPVVKGQPNVSNQPRHDHYDSCGKYLGDKIRYAVLERAEATAWGLQWLHGPTRFEETDSYRQFRMHCSPQTDARTCGMHVILNAWCHALGLPVNPHFVADVPFYQQAQWTVNLALAGLADWDVVYTLLAGSGYVHATAQGVPASRRFTASVRMTGFGTLRDLYDQVKEEEDLQEMLLQSSQQGPGGH